MELKEFVSETIKQIIDGVIEAQKYAKDKEAQVNPSHLQPVSVKKEGTVFKDNLGSRFAQTIEFDVAITAVDSSKLGAGAGLSVASLFKAGVNGETSENNSTANRIKFELPVILPNQHHQK